MKIKDYKLFLENQSEEEIDSICQKYDITNYTINGDGTVDVDGNVYLYDENLVKLPLKFGKVTGYFSCSNNVLTSLEGAPHWVGGDFNCSLNILVTLEGGPKWVGHDFICNDNRLRTLKGGPEVVLGDYFFNKNKLINFKGFPEDFDGDVSPFQTPLYSKFLYQIPKEKWNKFIYWCNEYEVIDDLGNINEERIEEVYHKLGLEYNED